MRLLRISEHGAFELEEFVDSDHAPPYAILSHTWGSNEISLKDLQHKDDVKSKAGYQKIAACCRQALKDQLRYLWVDTCCIDKSSSAELSEAINSMFKWYAQAQICYAYLVDVEFCLEPHILNPELAATLNRKAQEFRNSRWFARGWTLQELIAPRNLTFFSRNWYKIGQKEHMTSELSEITGINEAVLLGKLSLRDVSIAQKMSWAARRTTTRQEDMAYSLMGLFGVNIPLLYGEGRKAFFRLQEEIVKHSDDQSIFAWTDCDDEAENIFLLNAERVSGMLAHTPAQFANSGHIYFTQLEPGLQLENLRSTFSITNQGLQIQLPVKGVDSSGLSIGVLTCRHGSPGGDDPVVGIHLRPIGLPQGGQYVRYHGKKLARISRYARFGPSRDICVTNNVYSSALTAPSRRAFCIQQGASELWDSWTLTSVWPKHGWNSERGMIMAPEFETALLYKHMNGESFVLLTGWRDHRRSPVPFFTQNAFSCKINADPQGGYEMSSWIHDQDGFKAAKSTYVLKNGVTATASIEKIRLEGSAHDSRVEYRIEIDLEHQHPPRTRTPSTNLSVWRQHLRSASNVSVDKVQHVRSASSTSLDQLHARRTFSGSTDRGHSPVQDV